MNEPSPRERDIFIEALGEPRAGRAAFVARACGQDAPLRRSVEALLRAHDEAGEFLAAPALAPAMATSVEMPGQYIGRYRLVRIIGEGGCGVVFLAEQAEPVSRQVALKVIKPGMDTRQVIARFEVERQALAMMDHPNIAQVFDAGATSAGHPYFVMELVPGEPITAFCDGRHASIGARLALFQQVCHAIQHAHQKGIIHRDIKPSNILVGEREGGWLPKVIDFGIAKAVGGPLTAAGTITVSEQLMGTPAYMSPEQLAQGAADVDTRSDIYALGALLVELLTGGPPFEREGVGGAGFDRVRQIVSAVEPARPSAQVETLAPEVRLRRAADRALGPAAFAPALRGDLDWIALRCLEKERRRRYPTAHELALDVERYLHDEPLAARPPDRIYRLRKYARRHRVVLAAAAAALVASLVGMLVAAGGFRDAVRARREAEQQRELAVAALRESEAVTAFLSETLAAADPWNAGPAVTVRAMLDAAGPRLARRFADQPLLEARLRETIGQTYSGLGVFEAAKLHFQSTVATREAALGPGHELTLRARSDLSWALSQNGEAARADALARETLRRYAQHPGHPRRDVAWAQHTLGEALHMQARSEPAIEWITRAVAAFEAECGPGHRDTLAAKNSLVKALFIAGRYPAVRQVCAAVFARTDVDRDDPWRVRLAFTDGNAATELGLFEEAAAGSREALEIARRVFGEDSASTVMLRANLGYALARLGEVESGLPMLESASRELPRLVGQSHWNAVVLPARLVVVYAQVGRHEEAVRLGREANRRFQSAPALAAIWNEGLVDALNATGQFDESEQLCRELLGRIASGSPRHEYGISRMRLALARTLAARRRWEEAERELLENHATLTALDFDVRYELRRTREALVQLYEDWRRPEPAALWRATLQPAAVP